MSNGDYYMHLADLKSYLEADCGLVELYANSEQWARKAILNVAGSGNFSSDRTIVESDWFAQTRADHFESLPTQKQAGAR